MEVFLTSPWVPAEWVKAHGLEPRSIWSAPDFWPGTLPLSAGICAFAEAVVKYAQTRPGAVVVFTTTCDQLRRGFDVALPNSDARGFLFNLPATWQSPAARELFRAELERLGRFLVQLGGRAPTPDILRRELLRYAERRKHLLEASASGSAQHFVEAIACLHRDGAFFPPPAAGPGKGVALAMVGGPFCAAHWPLLEVLEAAGGNVALNATETGERCLCPVCEFTAAEDEPFEVMLNGYFDSIVDVFQRPNTPLYAWLRPRLRARNIRGIVLWHLTGCDLWRAEAQTMRETFGLPLLLLEAEQTPGASARETNRIQAFVETLK